MSKIVEYANWDLPPNPDFINANEPHPNWLTLAGDSIRFIKWNASKRTTESYKYASIKHCVVLKAPILINQIKSNSVWRVEIADDVASSAHLPHRYGAWHKTFILSAPENPVPPERIRPMSALIAQNAPLTPLDYFGWVSPAVASALIYGNTTKACIDQVLSLATGWEKMPFEMPDTLRTPASVLLRFADVEAAASERATRKRKERSEAKNAYRLSQSIQEITL